MFDYIKKSSNDINKIMPKKLFNNILIIFKDDFLIDLDINKIIKIIKKKIPEHFFSYIDEILIGQFDILKERKIEALYFENTIYISNEQSSEDDFAEDIIHEIAHSLEQNLKDQIYGDLSIINEFKYKRDLLKVKLKSNRFNVPKEYSDIFFSKEVDTFFYEEVGYGRIVTLCGNLFINPYGATSIEEYWATGFEEYYINNNKLLAQISPALYSKIEELIEEFEK